MSELVQVKIKGLVVTARYGTLSTGDILRTDKEFAKHLVEDCAAADYVTAKNGGTTGNAVITKPVKVDKKEVAAKAKAEAEAKLAAEAKAKEEAEAEAKYAEASKAIEQEIAALEAQLAAATEADKPAIQAALEAKQDEYAAL